MFARLASIYRSSVVAVAALLALLPLLAACGGAAPSSVAPVPSRPAADAAGADAAPALALARPTVAAASGGEVEIAAEAPVADGAAAGDAPIPLAPAVTGPLPTPLPPEASGQHGGAPLKAGLVDDNLDFAAYRQYLASYYGPPARPIDISERYILTVLNDQQQPVLDARVRLFDGQQQVFDGRTYAGGKTIVFPRALGLGDNQEQLRVVIEKGNSTAEGSLARGQDETYAFTLAGATALPEQVKLDILFLLDATGSMGDEITQIQQTILSIAERIDRLSPRPAVRFGLVAYRDRGDDFVTRVYDFTPDVTTFQKLLLSVRAEGGGDTPEALNEGLHAALQQVAWADHAVRLTFLVADAPPHLDYAQDYDYVQELRAAVARGVKIYPIAASNTDTQAEYVFRQLAQQTLARFIFLTYQPGQETGAPGDTTTMSVDPQAFTVERLDDLVVDVVERELALAAGAS